MDHCISYLFSAEVQLLSADLLLADRQLADISRPEWPILVGPSGRVADTILGPATRPPIQYLDYKA